MPDPERLLRTLDKARAGFVSTPGRSGRLVRLPAGVEVLVAGDLHGNVENFRLLLQNAELAKHPRRHLVLQELIHGPYRYPAGGDKSHQLLDLAAALKCQYPDCVHVLPGNHELAQWTAQRIGKGDEDYNETFRAGVGTAYGEHGAAVYQAYLDLIAAMPMALRTANRIFLSHSLPGASRLAAFDPVRLERDSCEPEDLRLGGMLHALVWGRDTRPETAAAFLGKVDADLLITGHIPCDRGFDTPNDRQLILDSLGTPACYCLFPTDRPLSLQDLVAAVGTL
jgi:Calcineurin-like phosphoesterase